MDNLITTNTVWSSNVYVLNQPVTVFPGVTLVIQGMEKPVKVQFGNDASIRVQSGASIILDHVVFEPSPSSENTNGVVFLNEDSAFLNASRWTCQNMDSCVQRSCCHGNLVSIQDSIFQENDVALSGYSGLNLQVSNSVFLRNNKAIANADYEIAGCVFAYNDIAVEAERATVRDTIFMGNTQAMQDPNSGGTYMDNVIFYRNKEALTPNCCGNEMGGFRRVTFLENTIAIQSRGGFESSLSHVNFIDSTEYHIKHYTKRYY